MWKTYFFISVLLVLLFLPLSAEVCLSETEWAELEMIWTELEELVEQQEMELEFLTMQLTAVSKEIDTLQVYLKKADLSLTELEKEHKREMVVWVMGSLLVGGTAGLFAGIMLE